MQPGTANDGSVLVRQLRGVGTNIVDEKTLKHQPADRVPVDQVRGSTNGGGLTVRLMMVQKLFFHKFLNMKKEDPKLKGRKQSQDEDSDSGGADNEDDIESDDEGAETDEEEEEEIWKVCIFAEQPHIGR